jgi:hypothetical protein
MVELAAAAQHGVNVVMVIKEGARWGDTNGNLLSHPPQHTIKALGRELQSLFNSKSVYLRYTHGGLFRRLA